MDNNIRAQYKKRDKKIRTCLACGKPVNSRRKYCSSTCCEYLAAQLDRWSGLLVGLEVRYANFWFTETILVLDVLCNNSCEVLRFVYTRNPGKKPSEDFFQMANELGTSWWDAVKKTGKRYSAAGHVLLKAQKAGVSPEALKPKVSKRPRVNKQSLQCLKLNIDDLFSTAALQRVKSAYRREALKQHPDTGGSSRSFIKLRKAYEDLSNMVKQHGDSSGGLQINDLTILTTLKAIPGKWCYDGVKRKWYRPAMV